MLLVCVSLPLLVHVLFVLSFAFSQLSMQVVLGLARIQMAAK